MTAHKSFACRSHELAGKESVGLVYFRGGGLRGSLLMPPSAGGGAIQPSRESTGEDGPLGQLLPSRCEKPASDPVTSLGRKGTLCT